jgi:hypothetical protein
LLPEHNLGRKHCDILGHKDKQPHKHCQPRELGYKHFYHNLFLQSPCGFYLDIRYPILFYCSGIVNSNTLHLRYYPPALVSLLGPSDFIVGTFFLMGVGVDGVEVLPGVPFIPPPVCVFVPLLLLPLVVDVGAISL